ncbi:MAG: hypothetical protein IJR88_02320 [Clostridia bacterium]|nr:hypothetical protein [Clostridia bacterium]
MKRLLIEYKIFQDHLLEIKSFLKTMSMSAISSRLLSNIKSKVFDGEESFYLSTLKETKNSQIVNNAIIISLYGCFENYISSILGVFLEIVLENHKKHSELPQSLQKKYREKIGDYLSSPQRYKGYDFEFEKEIEKYNQVLNLNTLSCINKVFALAHSGNIHVDEICEIMNSLGICDGKSKILDEPIFKGYYIPSFMDEHEFQLKRTNNISDLFLPIEILIKQRNTVAHSWNNSDRLSLEEIDNRLIPFVEVFCDCLCRICIRESLGYSKIENQKFQTKKPINVFNNYIVCFNNSYKNIKINDYLIYKTGDRVYIGKIINIQKDHIEKEAITSDLSVDIGVELDTPVKIESRIHAIVDAL